MYARIIVILPAAAEGCFGPDGNHRRYPRPPKLSDLQTVALAVTACALECDSENLLFAKLQDYPAFLPERPCRQSYNRRRRRLRPLIDRVNATIADWLDDACGDGGPDIDSRDVLIVDSIPIETTRVNRERQSRACRRPELDAMCADKTYHSSTKRWIVGYKLHLVTTRSGVYVEHDLRPASHHDLTVLRELADLASVGDLDAGLVARLGKGRALLADKAYGSAPAQAELFDELGTHLLAIPKENAKNWAPWPYDRKVARSYIETVFSQLCDECRLKRNLAKRYRGLRARVSTKLLARTVKQFVNHHTGTPLNQTKHCWVG